MKIESSVNGEQLIEIKLEGTLKLTPLEARELLDSLAVSGLADNAVMRVGSSQHWTKLCSRWGSAARFTVAEREIDEFNNKVKRC